MGTDDSRGENMAIGKKGVFYTLLAIVFILVLIFFVKIKTESKLTDKIDLTRTRIDTMNNFVDAVEEDVERALYISGFRSMLAFNQYLLKSNGTYLNSTQEAFQEAIFNGTVNGEEDALISGSTFYDWVTNVREKGNNLNIELQMNEPELAVYQTDPWHIKLDLNVTVVAQDVKGMASWYRRSNIISTISIEGFEDPLYIVQTYGRYTNIVNRTIYEGNYTYEVTPGVWNVNNLKDHVTKMYYTENSDAPDFLMRFEGKLTDSPNGIESMINLEKLNSQGIPVYQYSVVDHEYWSETSGRTVSGMQSWFRIDTGHETKYQVESIS
ncbi:MAG: hypothetical protein ABIH63_00705 [archaeon]